MTEQLSFWKGPWARFLLAALIVFGLRIHTLEQIVVDWDESVYLVVAQDLVDGGTLYRTAWDHKGPLLYAVLSPVVALADGSMVPVRLFATTWLLLTMLFVELIARRLVPSQVSFAAPLLYGVFFSVPVFGGLAANGELFMMMPACAAVWAGLVWMDARRSRWLLLSGVLTGAAFLFKPTAVLSVAVVPLLVLSRDVGHGGGERLRRVCIDGAWFGAGVLAPLAGALLVFTAAGNLGDALYATVVFNRAYVAGTPFLESWQQLSAFFGWAVLGDPFTFAAVVGGVFLVLRRRSDHPWPDWTGLFLAGLTLGSLAGVCLGRNLYFHYYLQMALPIALVVTVAAAGLAAPRGVWRKLAPALLLLAALSAFSPHRSGPEGLTRTPEEDRTLRVVAGYLAQNKAPDDTLFVLGGQPVLHYLTGMPSPTPYVFWLFHADRWDAILGSRGATLEAFASSPPDWFVFRPHDVRVPELEAFMMRSYQPVAEFGDTRIARRVP